MSDTAAMPGADSFRIMFDDEALEALNIGVDIKSVRNGTVLRVRTRRSEYRLELCDGARGIVTVQGGAMFPNEVVMRLTGSTFGGGLLKVGWIVPGLSLEFNSGCSRVVTSPVVSVEVVEPVPHAA